MRSVPGCIPTQSVGTIMGWAAYVGPGVFASLSGEGAPCCCTSP